MQIRAKKKVISKIADGIYILESSGGVHDSCLAQGKYNGFGFMDGGGGDQTCFPTPKEVRKQVEAWLGKRAQTMTTAQLLCFYNLGKAVNTCPYYQKYQKLNK